MSAYDYDVIVIGSGFGGSVAALRLAEKGYSVCVLEAGRRFERESLPKNSWDLRNYLWAPSLGLYGIQRIHLLNNVMILAGAGVGGGSLNYANTLYVPPPAFFQDSQWGHITDWQEELRTHYDQARRMLGVRLNPTMTPSDVHLKAAAERMGVGDSFHRAPVGVFFGDGEDARDTTESGESAESPESAESAEATAGPDAEQDSRHAPGAEVPDPYFGGAGPSRRACTECGECMTGCRHGAKNTLTENYLHLAEQAGARILPMATVVDVREDSGSAQAAEQAADRTTDDATTDDATTESADGPDTETERGYLVSLVPTNSRRGRGSRRRRRGTPAGPPRAARVLRARKVVVAAGTYGTQTLLHRMRDSGALPGISARLGELTRTNSEALVGAQTNARRYRNKYGRERKLDFTRGVAITSSIHPNDDTHIEPVRYGKGSNAMGALTTLQVRHGTRLPRALAHVLTCLRHPMLFGLSLSQRKWSERVIIGLVMQTLDNSLSTYRKPGGAGKGLLTARQGHGAPNPLYLPEGAEAASHLAEEINGFPGSNIGEVMGTPLTAHFLGGCPIGADAVSGVIDPYQRLYGHPGISVVDGSAVSANLGVNPALTITAQAERAMSLWPNKGERDVRPAQGEAYERLPAVAPRHPAVPADAFGALRLPVLPVPTVPRKRAADAGDTESGQAETGQAETGQVETAQAGTVGGAEPGTTSEGGQVPD